MFAVSDVMLHVMRFTTTKTHKTHCCMLCVLHVHYFAFCPTFSSENSLDENLLGTPSMHVRIILKF